MPAPVVLAAAMRPAPSADEAAARHAQADDNAREAARLQELVRQEKMQEIRLVAIRQRQAIQQAAAEAQARMAARRVLRTPPVAAEVDRAETKALPLTEALAEPGPADSETSRAPYVVRKGDYLTKLAREHGLTTAQLVAWNRLESETVVPSQRLVFSAPEDGPLTEPAGRKPVSGTPQRPVAAASQLPNKDLTVPQVHLVQPGDTLFNLSRRFGVSVQRLREANHLTSDDVKLGQKLLVPRG